MRVFTPEGYSEGSSDYPKTGELPKKKALFGKQAESKGLNPEQNAVIRQLLEEIMKAETVKNAVRVKDLNAELDDELAQAGIDRNELKNLFGEYFEEEGDEYSAVEGDEEEGDVTAAGEEESRDELAQRKTEQMRTGMTKIGSFAKHNRPKRRKAA